MFINEQSFSSGCLSVEFSTASQDGLQSLCVRAAEACCLTAARTVVDAGKVMIETARWLDFPSGTDGSDLTI